MKPLLIGTGFWSDRESFFDNLSLFNRWLDNTALVSENIVVVDNSERPLNQESLWPARAIRCERNLGHVCNRLAATPTPLLGWSMSWIQSALVAYADGCDFIYKEQDCFAFGDWLTIVRNNQETAMSFGRNQVVGCEQSLFYIQHHYILTAVRNYLAMQEHDCDLIPEQKFMRMRSHSPSDVGYHSLPGGRDRPLPNLKKPFYAQKITPEEWIQIKAYQCE